MRKISVFLILLIMLYGSAHYIVYWSMLKSIKLEVKHRMKHNLKQQDLELFTFSINQELPEGAVWEENGKEFSYHGRMYDVVRKEIKGTQKKLWCINDTKEASLKHYYTTLFQSDYGRKKEMSDKHLKSLRLLNLFLLPSKDIVNNFKYSPDHRSSFSIEKLKSGFYSYTPPPPQTS